MDKSKSLGITRKTYLYYPFIGENLEIADYRIDCNKYLWDCTQFIEKHNSEVNPDLLMSVGLEQIRVYRIKCPVNCGGLPYSGSACAEEYPIIDRLLDVAAVSEAKAFCVSNCRNVSLGYGKSHGGFPNSEEFIRAMIYTIFLKLVEIQLQTDITQIHILFGVPSSVHKKLFADIGSLPQKIPITSRSVPSRVRRGSKGEPPSPSGKRRTERMATMSFFPLALENGSVRFDTEHTACYNLKQVALYRSKQQ